MRKTVKTANYLCTLRAGEIVDEYQLLAKEYKQVLNLLKVEQKEHDKLKGILENTECGNCQEKGREIERLNAIIALIETCNATHVKEIEKFKHDMQRLNIVKDHLESKLSEAKVDHEALVKDYAELLEKHKELQEEFKIARQNHWKSEKSMEEEVRECNNRNQFLQSEVEASNIKIHQLEASIKELRWVVKHK